MTSPFAMPDFVSGMPDRSGVMGPMPVVQGPPPSLWDRIQQAAMGGGPTDGLLSDDAIKNARKQGMLNFGLSLLQQSGPTTEKVGFGQALGRALQQGQGTYQSALDAQRQAMIQKQSFDANKLKMGMMQSEAADAAKSKAARDAVFAKFPPPADDKDPKAVLQWIDQVTPALVAAQDYDSAEKLTALRKSMTEKNLTQQTQAGDLVTSFVPGKGFWDPRANGGKGAWVPSIDRGVPADQLEMKRLQLAEQRARTAAMVGVAGERMLNTQAAAFQNRYKSIAERAPIINQALVTVRQAQNDPALYKSAIANFVQAADQRAQLRSQMLQFFSQLDPSIGGRWETLKAKMLEGKLPTYQSGAMIRHLEALKALSKGEWDQRRAGEIKRHPNLEGWLPPGDEIFDAPAVPSAASPDDLTQQYGPLQ